LDSRGIEGGGRLVEDEDFGLPGERAGQPRSPLHAEREAAHLAVGRPEKVHLGKDLIDCG
jgi:hypothetical protein